jgi:hypothetical protein
MLELIVVAALVPLIASASPDCAAPTIVSATKTSMHRDGARNIYETAIVVKNTSNREQSPSVLESVEVFQDDTKVGEIGLLPIAPGHSQTVHYELQRSANGRTGSTQLQFRLVMNDPHGMAGSACSPSTHGYRLDV